MRSENFISVVFEEKTKQKSLKLSRFQQALGYFVTMARHRNIRQMNYADGELDNKSIKVNFKEIFKFSEFDYDDNVGSLDDRECISPTDAGQWMYDRARGQSSLDQFMATNPNIQEATEEEEEDPAYSSKGRRDSENFQMPDLNDLDKSKLLSCMEEIRNIIGEIHSDRRLTEVILACNFDFQIALDTLLKGEPQPQPHSSKQTDTIEKGNSI